mgnify:CR=1 FL=1
MIAFILIVTVNLILLLVVNYYYTHVVVRNTQEYHIKQVEQGQWDALAFGSAYCRFGIDFSGGGKRVCGQRFCPDLSETFSG